MNIFEALKTELPLARLNDPIHRGSHMCGFVDPTYLIDVIKLTKEDLLADDWIVQKNIQITQTDLIIAVIDTLVEIESECRTIYQFGYSERTLITKLIEKLGFNK